MSVGLWNLLQTGTPWFCIITMVLGDYEPADQRGVTTLSTGTGFAGLVWSRIVDRVPGSPGSSGRARATPRILSPSVRFKHFLLGRQGSHCSSWDGELFESAGNQGHGPTWLMIACAS